MSRLPPVGHTPTYRAGTSHWCVCTCGWRSQLHSSFEAVQAAFREHKEKS